MRRLANQIIIMIVSFILFLGLIGLLVYIHDSYQQTEETTTLYTATVTGVEIVDNGEYTSACIYTKEYENYLLITSNIIQNIKMDDVKNLENGQTIYFGIENENAPQMNKVEFLHITSLKTDTKVIFSLADYNQYGLESFLPGRILIIIVAVLFLANAISCFLRIKKRNKTA